jgi:flagellar biosynthesis protein FlhG
MKPFSEQSHYEVLELSPEASADQVERAYRVARSTYAPDSLATYSLYDERDLVVIQERIELAYKVLSDEGQRRAYDEQLNAGPRVELALSFANDDEASLEGSPEIRGFEEPEDGAWTGARLRRLRMARGVELERLASATKVSASYLTALEDERFDALPATVYVRGFVTAYARAIGLDAERVVPPYMERVLAARPAKPGRSVVRRLR